MSRRERVLQAVADLTAKHGFSPSYEEIAEAAGLPTRSAVLYHLRALRAQGRVTFNDGQPRTVRVVEREPAQP